MWGKLSIITTITIDARYEFITQTLHGTASIPAFDVL